MNSFYRILKYKIAEQWRETSPAVKRTLVSVAVVFVHLSAYSHPIGERIELSARELWYRLRGPLPAPTSVTYVRLDAETIRAIGIPSDGMIPRRVFATALDKITAAGAKMIVLDFFFFAEGADKEGDRELAEALSRSPSVIGRSVTARTEVDPSGKQIQRLEQKRPLPMFAKAAKAVVPLQVQLNSSRMVEQITLPPEILEDNNTTTPLLDALGNIAGNGFDFHVIPEHIPRPFDLINFYGEPSSLPNLSLAALLRTDKSPPEEYFRDRVVFIGPATHAAPGVPGKDSFRVPVSSEEMYGVEIHATIVANLLERTWIRRLSPQWEQLILNWFGVLGVVVLLLLSPGAAALASAALGITWAVMAYLAFSRIYWVVPGATLFVLLIPALFVIRWGLWRRGELANAPQ